MKQTTYAIIVFIALFVAAAVIEAFPIVSFIALFIMAWGVWKGQLWDFREEKEKPAESSDRQRKISTKSVYH